MYVISLLLPFFAANSLTLAAIMKYIHINQNKIMDVLNTHILSFRNNLSRVVFASVIVSRTPFRSPCKCETHLTHLVHTRDVPHAINCESSMLYYSLGTWTSIDFISFHSKWKSILIFKKSISSKMLSILFHPPENLSVEGNWRERERKRH